MNLAGALRITNDLYVAGVPLLAGTGAIPIAGHGVMLHRELELLVEAGLAPGKALGAATSSLARYFGLTDRGRIGLDLVADLLLVDGDPTSDITATRDIAGIWCRGVYFDRGEYRAQLEAASR